MSYFRKASFFLCIILCAACGLANKKKSGKKPSNEPKPFSLALSSLTKPAKVKTISSDDLPEEISNSSVVLEDGDDENTDKSESDKCLDQKNLKITSTKSMLKVVGKLDLTACENLEDDESSAQHTSKTISTVLDVQVEFTGPNTDLSQLNQQNLPDNGVESILPDGDFKAIWRYEYNNREEKGFKVPGPTAQVSFRLAVSLSDKNGMPCDLSVRNKKITLKNCVEVKVFEKEAKVGSKAVDETASNDGKHGWEFHTGTDFERATFTNAVRPQHPTKENQFYLSGDISMSLNDWEVIFSREGDAMTQWTASRGTESLSGSLLEE